MKYLIIISFLFLSISSVSGQNNAVTKEKDTLEVTSQTGIFGDSSLISIKRDTSLNFLHRYSLTQRSEGFFQQSATAGRQTKSLLLSSYRFKAFDFGLNAQADFLFQPSNFQVLSNQTPYTQAHYTSGGGKEQFFEVTHSQTLLRKLSLGVHYRIINTPGVYFRERTDNTQAFLYAQYGNMSDRFRIGAAYYSNRFSAEENGGLRNQSDFQDSARTDRKLLAVNLETASSSTRLRGGILQADFSLQKPEKEDTNQMKAGRLFYRFNIQGSGFSFTDEGPLSLYYPMPRYSFTKTADSAGYRHNEHTFGWSNFTKGSQILSISIQNSLRNVGIWQMDTSFRYMQNVPLAAVRLRLSNTVLLNSGLQLVTGNLNKGDYHFNSAISWNQQHSALSARYEMSSRHAPFLMRRFDSNHYHWEEIFTNETRQIVKLGLFLKQIDFELFFQQISKPFFFNGLSQPQQYAGSIPTASVSAHIPFKQGIFEMDNHLVYQYSGKRDIINIPEFLASGAYWVNLELFKKALYAQAGLDLSYYSSWFAQGYNPVNGQFYHQRKQKTGNYLFADVFLNFKIKSAQLFVKYQHFNAGISGYNYYLSPDLPMQDASFKFGVKWTFYN